MKRTLELAAASLIATGLLACDGIGSGTAPTTLILSLGGALEDAQIAQCSAQSARADVIFSNDTRADFATRARWSSSDESVLVVSNGDFISDEGRFLPGAVLPIAPGTATITVNYLNFEQSLDVEVLPLKLELSPVEQTLAQGTALQLRASGIVETASNLLVTELTGAGTWSVSALDTTDPVTSINAQTGVLSAMASSAGRDRARFRIDFCDTEAEVDVTVVDQTIASLALVSEQDTATPVSTVDLVPDGSTGLRAIATYSGGLTQDISGSVNFDFGQSDVAFSGLRGIGVVSGLFAASGQQTTLTARFSTDATTTADDILSQTVTVNVLDVALDASSLTISPANAIVLPGTGVQYGIRADFSGPGGNVNADLTRDVTWSSANTTRATINNVNGARGFAFGSLSDFGDVAISAIRGQTDAPTTIPTTTLTIGSSDGMDNVQLTALNLAPSAGASSELARGDVLAILATGELANSQRSDLTQDLTTSVIWSSSDESIAVVSNATGSKGLVRAVTDLADQPVTITARYFNQAVQPMAISGDLALTINPGSAAP